MYFLYSVLMAIGCALASPYFFFKGIRSGKYLSNLDERFGRVPEGLAARLRASTASPIWIHAVSVGEVAAALPLARALKERFPDQPLVISTTTMTGQQVAKDRVSFADGVFYFPFDWTWCVRRVMRAVRPGAIIVFETEIWPNFLREASRESVPVVFVNGRLSDRSFARYKRALAIFGFVLRGFLRRVLADATLFLMQTSEDAERIRALGVPAAKVIVAGNLKYDSPKPVQSEFGGWLAESLARAGRRPVIVAGSVTAHEEPLVLIAFGVLQGQMKNAFLVMAPRKPDRFDAAAQHIEESQRRYIRRSAIQDLKNGHEDFSVGTDVLLLDSIGELAGLYRLADGVFIGGSMVQAGGHNILEPAGFGKPPLFGESMENFAEIAREFISRGAGRQVENPEDLGVAWIELVENPEKNRKMGEAARQLIEQNRGATARCIAQIAAVLKTTDIPAIATSENSASVRAQDSGGGA
jgi:3-deoxy-D-manno-octulosonic-acid transferase